VGFETNYTKVKKIDSLPGSRLGSINHGIRFAL